MGEVESLAQRFREFHDNHKLNFGKVSEARIQEIWNEQEFLQTDMRAISSEQIRVLKPGIWNRDEGPDFMHAEIEIDGQLRVGDVEIHVQASEWYTHKHHLNSRYNRVILHSVLVDDGFNLRTRLQNGKRVPTLELLQWIPAGTGDLYDYAKDTTPTDGVCRITGNPLDIEILRGVFESLGQQRFLEKTESIRLLRTRLNFEQLLYEGIMEALGYTLNSKPLRELAQHLPFAELEQKSVLEAQAILFGVAGLLPSQRNKKFRPEVTTDPTVVRLEELWQASGYTGLPRAMTETRWRFKGRPLNNPVRRIAAISQLIHASQGSLMMYFLPTCEKAVSADTQRALRALERDLCALLVLEPEGYWAQHSDFGTGGARDAVLIGKSRAMDIIVNKILPAAYVWAVEAGSQELQNGILRLYGSGTKSTGNTIIRRIEKQLFSETQPMRLLKSTAKTEQGIIQLHKNYCADWLCDLCPVLEHGGASLEEG